MRPLTPVEAVLIAAVGGSVVCATMPAFVRNLRASRLSEPIDGLHRLATRASALAAGRPTALAYPPSVGMTPNRVPAGINLADAEGTWDHPTWRLLDFSFATPHAFAFAFESFVRMIKVHLWLRHTVTWMAMGSLVLSKYGALSRPTANLK